MAKKLTSKKAKEILHDKSVHGHPLTDKQRRFFGAVASGYIKAQNGIEGTMGGLTDIPFKYNSAWGGQFQTGGKIDEAAFQEFFKTLPINLRVDSPDYNLRGYWDDLGRPAAFDYTQPKEEDGKYHGYSRHSVTGEILKRPSHPTFKMAIEEDRKIGYFPIVTPEGTVKTVTGKKFQTGGLWNSDKRGYVDSVLNANKNLDWVQRLYESNPKAVIVPGERYPSTHLMSDNDQGYIFPQIVNMNGQLVDLGERAEDYARETNTGIQLPVEQGTWFARSTSDKSGYKMGTGVMKGKPVMQKYKSIDKHAMGGSIPGSVGFTYARIAGAAPSNGPYAKKTKASAQNGGMAYYQHGLDFKPRMISKNGGWLDKYLSKAQDGLVDPQKDTKLLNDLSKRKEFEKYIKNQPQLTQGKKEIQSTNKSNGRSFWETASQFIPVYEQFLDVKDIVQGAFTGDTEMRNRGIVGMAAPFSGKAVMGGLDYLTEKTQGKETADYYEQARKDVINRGPAFNKALFKKYGWGGYDKWVADGKPSLKGYYKKGGVIKDDMGQWAHPGEITEIGSNDITMQGVPYPVLGISDTGDTKLMQPGKDYKFKGKKVTEIPMMQVGGQQPTRADSLFLLNNNKIINNFLKSGNYKWADGKQMSMSPSLWKHVFKNEKKFFDTGIINEIKSGDKKGKLSDYQKRHDNMIGTSDWAPLGGDDLGFPIQYIHPNISPQYHGDLQSSDMDKFPFVYSYKYDDLAITPWNMLNPQQQKLRLQKFGTSGTPYDTKSKPTPKEKTLSKKKATPLKKINEPEVSPLSIIQREHPRTPLGVIQNLPYRVDYTDEAGKKTSQYFPSEKEGSKFVSELDKRSMGRGNTYGEYEKQKKNGGWLNKYK